MVWMSVLWLAALGWNERVLIYYTISISSIMTAAVLFVVVFVFPRAFLLFVVYLLVHSILACSHACTGAWGLQKRYGIPTKNKSENYISRNVIWESADNSDVLQNQQSFTCSDDAAKKRRMESPDKAFSVLLIEMRKMCKAVLLTSS